MEMVSGCVNCFKYKDPITSTESFNDVLTQLMWLGDVGKTKKIN